MPRPFFARLGNQCLLSILFCWRHFPHDRWAEVEPDRARWGVMAGSARAVFGVNRPRSVNLYRSLAVAEALAAACYFPARRAMRLDATIALRQGNAPCEPSSHVSWVALPGRTKI